MRYDDPYSRVRVVNKELDHDTNATVFFDVLGLLSNLQELSLYRMYPTSLINLPDSWRTPPTPELKILYIEASDERICDTLLGFFGRIEYLKIIEMYREGSYTSRDGHDRLEIVNLCPEP